MEEVSIPLSLLPTYECGATLFTYLAFPEPESEERRAYVHSALCHLALRAIVEDDPEIKWTPQNIKLGYALYDLDEAKRATKTMDRRLKNRLEAAIMAKPFLQHAVTGEGPSLPPGVKHVSLNSLAEYIQFRAKPDPDRGDIKNVHARVWRPSLPVIHLAVALNVLFERTIPAGLAKLAVTDLIRSPEAIRFLVETAQPLEPLLETIPRLNIGGETLIKFRLS